MPNNVIIESESLKYKLNFLDNTNNVRIINEKLAVPLK